MNSFIWVNTSPRTSSLASRCASRSACPIASLRVLSWPVISILADRSSTGSQQDSLFTTGTFRQPARLPGSTCPGSRWRYACAASISPFSGTLFNAEWTLNYRQPLFRCSWKTLGKARRFEVLCHISISFLFGIPTSGRFAWLLIEVRQAWHWGGVNQWHTAHLIPDICIF